MSAIRVVLVDDHALVRRGVRAWLEEAGDIEVVAEAADGERAIELVAAHRPDVLVTDIEMPGLSGIELTRRVALEFPDTKVLVLSIHKQKEFATKALAAGARGYLLKDAGEGECEAAVRGFPGRELSQSGDLGAPGRGVHTAGAGGRTVNRHTHAPPARGASPHRRGTADKGNRAAAVDQHQDRGCAPFSIDGAT